jgi:hypothetical protein
MLCDFRGSRSAGARHVASGTVYADQGGRGVQNAKRAVK